MTIKNEPKIKNPLIVAIREQLEHRALWMYLLVDEARKKGLEPSEYAPNEIKRCGLYQGSNLREKAGGGESLKVLNNIFVCIYFKYFLVVIFLVEKFIFT